MIIALIPIYLNKYLKKIYSIIILIIGISFLYAYFSNKRKFGIFNQPAWWHNLRLIHGVLYLISSIYLFKNNNLSSFVLLIDVFIGFIAFLNNHFFKIML
jgi:ABC-type xylose transport system permease subunit